MKCRSMWHFILVFNICQSTCLLLSGIKRVIVLGPIERPIDVSSAIQIPEVEMTPIGPQSPEQKGGLFGWFSGNKMISKVVEKTKVY